MTYGVKDKKILVEIPASNDSKFRFKTKKNNLEFGGIFSTRGNNFNKNVYLEWRVGYDATIKEI